VHCWRVGSSSTPKREATTGARARQAAAGARAQGAAAGSPRREAAALLGWVALSAVLPGVAHLKAGWRRTGLTLLCCHLAAVTCLVWTAVGADVGLLGWAVVRLSQVTVVTGAAAVAWFSLVIHSYAVLGPGRLPPAGRVVTALIAGALAVAVTVPFTLAARYAAVSERMLGEVFTGRAEDRPARGDPWAGRDRINVLLLGGDWGPGRIGMRTDSINVASVDVRTGDTVLIGLPRNLERVPFPPGSPMAARFPFGFDLPESRPGWREDLLYSVWQYADDHPELFGGRQGMGAEVMKETVGHILGLRIDWYALVNLRGFAELIDRLGGLVLTVDHDIVYGRHDEGVLPAGTRRLSGAETLWYARSRTYSDDYQRMRRQRCVFGALLAQADPAAVLRRFTEIAETASQIVRTDIPRPMLEHLVPLAWKVKRARVTMVQFIPPLISPANPDWDLIRRLTAEAVRGSRAPAAAAAPSQSGAAPGPQGEAAGPHPTGTPPVAPLAEGCGR